MAVTYEPIASTTLGSAAADVTFSSIPSTYTDLILVCVGTSTSASATALVAQVNSDTANNYSDTYLWGNGSANGSGRESSVARYYLGDWPQSGNTDISPGITRSHFLSYANTNIFKTMLSVNEGAAFVQRLVNLWRSTSAITSIKVYPISGNLSSGFTASLYGVKAA